MDPSRPPTKEEALRYNKEALETDIGRKRKSIQMFQKEIEKIEAEINWMFQVIAIIDANKNGK